MTTAQEPDARMAVDSSRWTTPGLAAVLGLGPLLAGSRTLAGGLALGVASLLVLCAINLLAALLSRGLGTRGRALALLILLAMLVTAVDLVFQAQDFGLYGQVGLFVPLIVANGLILTRADGAAARRNLWQALVDGLTYGTGFVFLLGGIGALRAGLVPGLLVAALPAGAFFLLAGGVALWQFWRLRRGSSMTSPR